VNTPKPPRRYVFIGLIALFLSAFPLRIFAATGHFDVYCDGVGIFLTKIDDAPAPGKLVLFSYKDFPPGTMGGRYFGQGKWSDVFVFRNGCVPDGKCESIAHGRVWIEGDASDPGDAPPKSISGKYEIDLNGKHLEGRFVAKQRLSKRPLRLCM
jgi:hypothetical protein